MNEAVTLIPPTEESAGRASPTIPAPAPDVVARFRDVLGAELDALRNADVDALVELQQHKRSALEALRERGVDLDVRNALADEAKANLELMHHLVSCLRGIVAADDSAVYGKQGSVQVSSDVGRNHGAA